MNKKTKLDFFELWNSVILKRLRNRFDKSNMFKSITHFPHQIIESFDIESKWYKNNKKNIDIISSDVESILICGMGGSAIGGELAKIVLAKYMKIPIVINRSHTIPNWVNSKTLIIISSYSGNTYETIQSFNQSREKTSKIISISSKTGMINDYCIQYNYSIVNIPSGLQPRCALGYISSMMILILVRLNLVNSSRKIKSDLKQSVSELNDVNRSLNNSNNQILSMSYRLRNTIPVIYGSEDFTSIAALRFKNQLQENAKMLSFSNNFPEINHNEIESWNKSNSNFSIVWLLDTSSNKQIVKTINSAHELINDLNINQEIIYLKDSCSRIAGLYRMIYSLDWISYYLALLNNRNPNTIDNIQFIKKNII